MNTYKKKVIVFLSGFMSMGFEMIAGYIINPVFGSSVFTWGSVIGSVLLGLSAGYYIGGKISEHINKKINILSSIYILLSFVLFISGFYGEELASLFRLPYQNLSPLLSSIILFGTPAFLFGIINPVIISLSEGKKGEVSGNIFAFSTLGSIFGVYLTTFYLIPFRGVKNTVILFSVICLIISLYIYRSKKNHNELVKLILILLFITGILIFSIIFVSTNININSENIHSETSFYTEVNIIDYEDGLRAMKFSDSRILQSIIDKDNKDRIVTNYVKYSTVPYINNKINNSLIIGGGGIISGRVHSKLSNNSTQIDIIERDKVVYNLAKEYMYFSPEDYQNINVIISDGREYIEKTNKSYDMIFMDVFNSKQVPPHMTTKEYYSSLKSKMNNNGYLVINIIGKDKFFRSEFKTINHVFNDYNSYWLSENGVNENQVLIFTKKEINFNEVINKSKNIKKYNLTQALKDNRNTSSIKTEDVPIITDNRNPSNIFSSY